MPSHARSKTQNSPQRHFVQTGPGCWHSRTEGASRRHGGNASPHPEWHTLAVATHAPKAPAAGTVAMPPHTPNGTHSPGLLTRRKRQPQARWHGFPTPRTVHTRRGRSRADKAFALSSPLPVWNALPRCARTPKDAARRSHIYDACGAGMPSRQTLYGTLWRCPIALSASHKKGSVRCLGSLFAACQRYRIRVLYSPSPVC